jgi:hypothetical protein
VRELTSPREPDREHEAQLFKGHPPRRERRKRANTRKLR